LAQRRAINLSIASRRHFLVAELLPDLLAQFGPGNQLGRPSCERVAQILVIAGFFLALAPSSVALWKLARQR